jgi:predicted TIM-barrel fold metal-dependent hydrolase
VEQFKAQCVISGEPADSGLGATVDLIGAENLLWASDWPHQDGAWPDPIALLKERPDLSSEQKRSIFVDSPARFYRIDLDELMVHLGEGWSRSAAIPG